MERNTIRPVVRPRYYMSAALTSWEGLLTNRLLLLPTQPIASYNSDLALDGEFLSLIFPFAQTMFAVYTAVQPLTLAREGVLDTFFIRSWLSFSSGCLASIENGLADLIDQVYICSFVHESDLVTASSAFAWKMIHANDWKELSSVVTGC